MAGYVQVFLALLLAHLLGDFPLQTRRMVLGKAAFRPGAYLRHGLAHLLASIAAVVLFTDLPLTGASTLAAFGLLIPGHLALDLVKSATIRGRPGLDGARLYTADQLLHVAIVAAATAVATAGPPPLDAIRAGWAEWHPDILVFSVVVAATVFPAGYLIRYLLKPLSDQLGAHAGGEPAGRASADGLGNAGLYLGWLERGLLVVAFAIGSFTAVGLIIGAKSIARFPEFRSRAFAEYFLIGTLISVAIAAAGGWLLRLSLLAMRG